MRTFVFTDSKSNKFWNIELHGASYTVTFGKVGTAGQTQIKEFANDLAAQKAYEKLVTEKLTKGYFETTSGKDMTAAPSPLLEALEQALVENPDDLAAHSAHADYLMEQDDPRGEFIQLQLTLEDPRLPASQQATLRKREKELITLHAKHWLGDMGRFLVGKWSGADKIIDYQFARGWLDHVRVSPFPQAMVAALMKCPQAKLLRHLEIVYDMRYHPFDFDEPLRGVTAAVTEDEGSGNEESYYDANDIIPLLDSPFLNNLRILKLGFSDSEDMLTHSTMVRPFGECRAHEIIALLEKCPRLEELYLNLDVTNIATLFASEALQNIRVFQYYYGSTHYGTPPIPGYPLTQLVNNPHLKQLTSLRLHPGRDAEIELTDFQALLHSSHLPNLKQLQVHMTRFGDEGCLALVDSTILQRLDVLDLGYGNISDEGAEILAACPDLKKLEVLNLTRNALTTRGITALKRTGIKLISDNQHDLDDQAYLYEVDQE